MVWFPGSETVPYHLGWIALGLVYGLDTWPLRWATGAVVGYAVISGLVLLDRAVRGEIAIEETTEIPLMGMLVILMIWHVNRRQDALAALDRLRLHERRHAERREHMARLISHEIKTTLTIAGGYLDLVLTQVRARATRDDLEVARDELHRLSRASERLLRMMRMQEDHTIEMVDVDALMRQTLERWSTVAEREWLLDARAGWAECVPHRLRACFDTLIENSLRHTPPDGTIRLFGIRVHGHLCLGVADSGPGLSDEQLRAVNRQSLRLTDVPSEAQQHPQTGLGLSIVQEVVLQRGGRLAAGCSEEGGALLVIVFPKVESRARVLLADPREALRLDALAPVTMSDSAVGAPSTASR
jgi:signal transduction histidine kinase